MQAAWIGWAHYPAWTRWISWVSGASDVHAQRTTHHTTLRRHTTSARHCFAGTQVECLPAHLTRLRALSLPRKLPDPHPSAPLPPIVADCTRLEVLCAPITAQLDALPGVWARMEATLRSLSSLQVSALPCV